MDDSEYDLQANEKTILDQFQASSLEQLEMEDKPLAVAALGVLLSYIRETQKDGAQR